MTNVHYLRGQLTMAMDCIRRGLDALEAEPAAEPSPAAAEPLAGALPPKAVLDSLGLVEVTPKEKLMVALVDRVDKLTRILLDIDEAACARHDLFAF